MDRLGGGKEMVHCGMTSISCTAYLQYMPIYGAETHSKQLVKAFKPQLMSISKSPSWFVLWWAMIGKPKRLSFISNVSDTCCFDLQLAVQMSSCKVIVLPLPLVIHSRPNKGTMRTGKAEIYISNNQYHCW